MASLLDQIRQRLSDARKSRDQHQTLLYSTILSDLRNREIELQHSLTEDEAQDVVRRGIKRRRESIEHYEKGGRADLAQKEAQEVTLLEEFVPAAMSADEIRGVVRTAIESGTTELGPLMAAVMAQLKGRAEGKLVNQIAREELAPAV